MTMRGWTIRLPDSLRNDFLDQCIKRKENPSKIARTLIRKWTYEKRD